jgi:6-phosphogluconolactonase/glucosamine-6-phosphate isomerase/deaminase
MILRKQIRSKIQNPRVRRARPELVQEEAGIYLSISSDLPAAAEHAASVFYEQYRQWRDKGRFAAWGRYKRQHFTVAVGGGNTLKAQYKALAGRFHSDIDWYRHVRFYLLEGSTGEESRESAENSLIVNFIMPLAEKLLRTRGIRRLADDLGMSPPLDLDDIIDRLVTTLLNPINLADAKKALDAGNKALASRLARREAQRYERDIRNRLGASMAFHVIISGIGKDGTLGALAPYSDELGIREPAVLLLKPPSGALRIALNRGVLTNAEYISLIVAGRHKLRALGRFEMEESADFEQTVRETPLRMLRESREIAERVHIFADEQALRFEETLFEYSEQGNAMLNKAETRAGEEPNGVHILLLHGFMGLFSFTTFLIRLPSAWTVSALHRGSHAKTLPEAEIFPHYARVLRKAILKTWRQGRPVPFAGHSIAGVISDHLLLSIIGDYDGSIPPYETLSPENRRLVDALRASGIIHLATWAPSDGPHTGENIRSLVSHRRHNTPLDYSGFDATYRQRAGSLQLTDEASVNDDDNLAGLGRFLDFRGAQPLVNMINLFMRSLLNNRTVQQRMLNTDTPYALRLVGNRLLKTASFYGLAKEINAAMHDPVAYQERHLKALDVLIEYDIPFLSIVHEDDFLVSAKRHREEHNYLVARRCSKEGVKRKSDLEVPVRFLPIRREQDELPTDPLNPHLMIMATSQEGNRMARQVTAAMTRFVNENVARATAKGWVEPLPSVRKWARENVPARKRRKRKLA